MTTENISSALRRPLRFFLCALLLALTLLTGVKAWNAFREHRFIGVPIERNTISVSGEGRVIAPTDIATIDLGMSVERKTVSDAQRENTRIMNELINKLQANGIAKKDIQTTSYNVMPRTDWVDGVTILRGYIVSQNVHVKIRNLDKAGELIGVAGELGLNQIGNLNFTVDEPEQYRQEAREIAMVNAREKAEALAKAAGVKLVRVISFNESEAGVPTPIYYAKDARLEGMGGAPAPSLESGSSEVVIYATMTYEIE